MTLEEFTKTDAFREELSAASAKRKHRRKIGAFVSLALFVITAALFALALAATVCKFKGVFWQVFTDGEALVLTGLFAIGSLLCLFFSLFGVNLDFSWVGGEFPSASKCVADAFADKRDDFCEDGALNVKLCVTKQNKITTAISVSGKTQTVRFDLTPFQGAFGANSVAAAICLELFPYLAERESRGVFFREVKFTVTNGSGEKRREKQIYLVKKGKRTASYKGFECSVERIKTGAEQGSRF